MAQPSDNYKRNKSFFHSLSKTQTEASQYVFESLYKSSHSVCSKEVWAEEIAYAGTVIEADNFVSSQPTRIKKYTEFSLTEIPGSNGQAWYINDSDTFIRPLIAPTDIPHETTAAPSYGYEAKLYKEDGSFISPTTGVFNIDYYAGVVVMQEGYTPSNLGWGNPKITCYVYIGNMVADVGSGGGASNFTDLNDTPTSYDAQAGKYLAVDNEENDIIFKEISSSGIVTHEHVIDDNISGEINGSNLTFITTYNYQNNSTRLFLNGMRQKLGNVYNENGSNIISFIDYAPQTNDELIVDYIKI